MPNSQQLFLQEEELADDIVGVVEYEAPLPQKKGFLPWHRPRKQYVRDYQWRHQIEELLPELQLDGGLLRYLGLPGVDLLDLRYFHDSICAPGGMKLRFLGFNSAACPNSAAQTELNISLDEVSRLPYVDPSSDVIPDDFRQVGNDRSIAWRQTRKLGPYDIINLDLCDGFAAEAPGGLESTHYDALNRLLSLQARNRNPWLLLLTTRVGKGHVHEDVLEKLVAKYRQNLVDCEAFKGASLERFFIGDGAQLSEAVGTENGLTNVFLTGICKWLLVCALGQNPPTKVELKSVIGYRVEQEAAHEDLISLALKFVPTFNPADDPIGLANQPPAALDECSLAKKLLNRVANRKNADAILAEDEPLHQKMAEAMAVLLELARYDVAEFHNWVQNGCPA